jgi:hypothetical protein
LDPDILFQCFLFFQRKEDEALVKKSKSSGDDEPSEPSEEFNSSDKEASKSNLSEKEASNSEELDASKSKELKEA